MIADERYENARRILIISDTHGRLRNLEALMSRFETPDLTIHCGDLEMPPSSVRRITGSDLVCVCGNCDYFSRRAGAPSGVPDPQDEDLLLYQERLIKIGRYRVWITHGNSFAINATPVMLQSAALDRGADIVLFGHTHRPYLDLDSRLIMANPGSLSLPRQENGRPSYMVMDLDSAGEAHFTLNYL